MKVKVAKSAGFCFGVKRAVGMAYEAADSGEGGVFTIGPIIHNEYVVNDLASRGVRVLDEDLRAVDDGGTPPPGSTVIIRSHGISRDLRERLDASGWRVIDATCPFVSKIHRIVAEKGKNGGYVVIVGNPEHPEVRGIRGWAGKNCAVVGNASDVFALSFPKEHPLTIVAQTTFNYQKFEELVEMMQSLGYHVDVTNTICNATKERQEEAFGLAGESDVMIVIGGKASSNTQKLYDICRARCPETFHVQSSDDLSRIQFKADSCVGITAGASTPNLIIQEVSFDVRRTEFCSDAGGIPEDSAQRGDR